ncbi:MAG: HPr family phosphocarrier protein [Bacillota bacterium]|nr:HPr family phosphocarrier protein [Bacillota bacterium]
MLEKTVEITNPSGLHARLAAMFVETAGRFTSKIWIIKDDRRVNAKSIMGLMSLAIANGEPVMISAEGEDEELAVKELIDLLTLY